MGTPISSLNDSNKEVDRRGSARPVKKLKISEPIESERKVSTRTKTAILIQKLDDLLKDNDDADNIREINNLKIAVNNIRINSLELAAKLGANTTKAILALNNHSVQGGAQNFRVCMRELLEIKLDTTIDSILDHSVEDNYLTRDLYNFYSGLLKRMAQNFHSVEAEYDKNLAYGNSNLRALLGRLNFSLGNITSSSY